MGALAWKELTGVTQGGVRTHTGGYAGRYKGLQDLRGVVAGEGCGDEGVEGRWLRVRLS